jgi:hypothetical protein
MRERRHTFRVLTRDLLSRPPNIEAIDVILHQNHMSIVRQDMAIFGSDQIIC